MHFFQSGAARLAYIDESPTGANRDEPILLVHGFASSHAVNWVFPLWVKTLTADGRRTIALDNRGHGRSEKFYEPDDYRTQAMADDALRLLDHLNIERADLMGYSMGARISAFVALKHPGRVRSLVIGGLGLHLVDGAGLPVGIADAMETDRPDLLTDHQQKVFRAFADATKSDRKALAACIRGSRQVLSVEEVARIATPTLICVGTKDDVAGDPHALGALFPDARVVDIPNRDHNRSVGDKVYREAVLDFLRTRR
ncbi:MAG: alpha/beta fold hydrolase [Hyphomicrobiales bacterium]|nr:alpha/beta fold hydrolase [Hyphomicrobiales bacterium]